jgi:hypothetical protein
MPLVCRFGRCNCWFPEGRCHVEKSPVTAPSLDPLGGRAIETAPRWHVTTCTLQVTLETMQSCDEPESSGFFN